MSTTKTPAIKIKSIYAEIIRKQLLDKKILRTDLKIKKVQKNVYIPIKNVERVKKELLKTFSYDIIKSDFESHPKKIHIYKDLLKLPQELQVLLPNSYDIIGSIINIKLDKKLIPYKQLIGNALLQANIHAKSIYGLKAIEGEYRTRSVYYIAGNKQKKTIHKEYGLQFEIDIAKTYFNPRLATERNYIASLVQPGEIILDMFTGVAPFPIRIARYAQPKEIIAIDKNKKAIELARKNIKRNKIKIPINLFCDDAKNIPIIIDKCKTYPTRIIMNLPFHAHHFFPHALQCINKKAMIHFYMIGNIDIIANHMQLLQNIAASNDFTIFIEKKREIKTYAPHEFYIGIDITAEKNK